MGLGFWNLPVTVTRRGRWLVKEMCETECAWWWWWSSVRFGEQFEMERLEMESERERDTVEDGE